MATDLQMALYALGLPHNNGEGLSLTDAQTARWLREFVAKKEAEKQQVLYKLGLLQSYQVLLPEPHRTIICSVIANGSYSDDDAEYDEIIKAISRANKSTAESEDYE